MDVKDSESFRNSQCSEAWFKLGRDTAGHKPGLENSHNLTLHT